MDAYDIELNLEKHAKWLRGEDGGQRADLSRADLSRADLSDEDLSGANLSGANLSGANLSGADLSGADLSGADLSGANLRGANLRGANLIGANLSDADLSDADLSGANLDFSAWPLRCGSFRARADIRLVAQLAKHFAMLDVSGCCGGIREAHAAFCRTGLAHLFDEYRSDVDPTPVEGKE